MGLRLHTVPARQGLRWTQQGLALWAKRPLGFVGLFALFMLAVLILSATVPWVGSMVGLAMLPMLSLGYMIASRQVIAGSRAMPSQLIEGLRHPVAAQRRAQWVLCGGYALGSMLVFALAHAVDGGAFEQLQRLLLTQESTGRSAELDQLLADPHLLQGMLVRLGLATLLSIPYWHAPALVHWGGQGALQALFSSTMALWRARLAFLVYMLCWLALLAASMGLLALLGSALGARALAGLLVVPMGLALTAAFYVSLWFSFHDSFVGADGTIAE